MKKLRVAVWGLGSHALRNILPALAGGKGHELAGVCSRNGDVVRDAAERYSCAGWTDADHMLASAVVDVVYVATPIALHAQQGMQVLRAGKHFWCEKPLSTTRADAENLADLAARSGLTIAEGFMYLYHPHFARVRDMVESGRLGDIHAVTARFGIPAMERPGFRLSPELCGGALLDVGCYGVSAAVALFERAEPDVLHAESVRRASDRVDRSGCAILRYPGGPRVVLEWATGVAYRSDIDIWGSRGALYSDRIFSKRPDYVPRVIFRDERGSVSHEDVQPANHFAEMFAAFRKLPDDGALAEKERSRVVRRAGLLEAVRHATQR